MLKILYRNSSMVGPGYLETLKTCRRNPTRNLQSLLSELKKNHSLTLAVFADVILLAESVRCGETNPLELLVSLNDDGYAIAPNGDLYRISPQGNKDDHLSLEAIKLIIGTRPAPAQIYKVFKGSITGNSTVGWATSSWQFVGEEHQDE